MGRALWARRGGRAGREVHRGVSVDLRGLLSPRFASFEVPLRQVTMFPILQEKEPERASGIYTDSWRELTDLITSVNKTGTL